MRITAQEMSGAPARDTRPVFEPAQADQCAALALLRSARSRTQFSGCRSPLALDDHRLPSANPAGWPRSLSSAQNVQTPISSNGREGDRVGGWGQLFFGFLYMNSKRR